MRYIRFPIAGGKTICQQRVGNVVCFRLNTKIIGVTCDGFQPRTVEPR